jgi:hypothetical protein
LDALPGGFDVHIAHDSQRHSSSLVLPIVEPQDLSVPASLAEPGSVWLQPSRPLD